MIAAPHSHSGKTTVARGLMALLREEGYAVQPFKCGPDYIDTKFHAAVCGRPSVNLDTFMATGQHVRHLIRRYAADADVAVVEGMMGLFDGFDRDRGSSADIASTAGLPVVLVVDARSASYSVAALLTGFLHFREGIHVCGVIFNKVGSARHYQLLQQVCADVGVECFGWVPRSADLEHDSRYLGLDFSQAADYAPLVALLRQHVDWRRLVDCCSVAASGTAFSPQLQDESDDPSVNRQLPDVCVALNDEAFSFVYQETLDAMQQPRFFNPECDEPLLTGSTLLYLPGGYPEKHLEALASAEATRRRIADFARRGGRIVAECGGMMYLCRHILTDDGDFPMCGVLPFDVSIRKADRRLSLGYRNIHLPDGRVVPGHEFHYSQYVGTPLLPDDAAPIRVTDARGQEVSSPVFRVGRVFASYIHLAPGFPQIKDGDGDGTGLS